MSKYQSQKSLGHFIDLSGRGMDIQIILDCDEDLAYTLPAIENLADLYAGRESNDFQPNESNIIKLIKQISYYHEAKKIIHLTKFEAGNIMDFGCGDGRLTNSLKEILRDQAEVYAVDFSSSAPQEIAKENICSYYSYAEMLNLQIKFDLIVARHVLEHSDQPLQMLAKLRQLLAAGGVLLIEVPNRRSPWATIFGKYWNFWYTPYHRIHYSAASLQKHIISSGFEIVGQTQDDQPSIGRSIQNILGIKYNISLFVLGSILYPIQVLLGLLTGQRSVLRVIAKKS